MEIKQINLNVNEANKLIQYLDIALKQLGLAEAKNIVYFTEKISMPFKEVKKKPVEEIKKEEIKTK